MNTPSGEAWPATVASSSLASRRTASDPIDVAVIGGGIVGAAAAIAAARCRLSVAWYAGPRQAGRAVAERDLRVYAISPATRLFLESLDVWGDLDATRIAAVHDMRVFGDRDATSRLHFGAYEAGLESLATIVEHAELMRALDLAVVRASGGPSFERIDALASLVPNDDAIAVRSDDGRPVRRARLVIAADGAASPTRDALGIAIDAKPYAQRAIVGNFTCMRPHAGTAFQWFTDDGVVALLPLPDLDGRPAVSLVWSAPESLAVESMAAGAGAVAARLDAFVQRELGSLHAASELKAFRLTLQTARSTTAARAVLVGDAAHVVHPLAGQGLNLGLQDVDVLIDIVASREAYRDCGDPRVLARYRRARIEPVHLMRRATDGLARLFSSRRRDVAWLRTTGLRLVDRAPTMKRLLMRQASGAASRAPSNTDRDDVPLVASTSFHSPPSLDPSPSSDRFASFDRSARSPR